MQYTFDEYSNTNYSLYIFICLIVLCVLGIVALIMYISKSSKQQKALDKLTKILSEGGEMIAEKQDGVVKDTTTVSEMTSDPGKDQPIDSNEPGETEAAATEEPVVGPAEEPVAAAEPAVSPEPAPQFDMGAMFAQAPAAAPEEPIAAAEPVFSPEPAPQFDMGPMFAQAPATAPEEPIAAAEPVVSPGPSIPQEQVAAPEPAIGAVFSDTADVARTAPPAEKDQHVIIADISSLAPTAGTIPKAESANNDMNVAGMKKSQTIVSKTASNDMFQQDIELNKQEKYEESLFYKEMQQRVHTQPGDNTQAGGPSGRMTYDTAKSGKIYDKQEIESIIKN